jgi:penicillin-binding protein 2
MRCWIYKMTNNTTTHSAKFGHDLNGSDAIMASCNIFFFEMGRRLGVKGIDDWFTRFGLGPQAVRWNLDGVAAPVDRPAGEEPEGDLQPPARSPFQEFPGFLPREKGTTSTDASLMGIGQGKIAWTPLHAADAYATIARGGLRIVPRLRRDAPLRQIDLGIDRRAVEQALDGLRRSVQERDGTTNHLSIDGPGGLKHEEPVFNSVMLPGIAVWAKSGTADAAALTEVVGYTDDGKPIRKAIRDGDHAWCLFLVGDGAMPLPGEQYSGARPRYAVAVVVDYGGSGGRVAGPIANQIIRALIVEGYLHTGKQEGGKGNGGASTSGTGVPPVRSTPG